MDLMAKLKRIPPWGWAVIGATVAAVGAVFLRRSSYGVPISPPAQLQTSGGSAPSPAAGPAPSSGFNELASLIGRLGTEQSRTNDALSALGQAQLEQGNLLASIGSARAMTFILPGGDPTAPSRSTPSFTDPADMVAVQPAVTSGRLALSDEIAEQQGVTFTETFTGFGRDPTAGTAAYDPTKDTFRIFDPLRPNQSLPAPAERSVQPAPVVIPSNPVGDAVQKGYITPDQAWNNGYRGPL